MIITTNQQTSVQVQVGGTFTIAAGSGVGSVIRQAYPIGAGEPYSPVVVNGGALTFGPYEEIAIFKLTCSAGTINYDVAKPSFTPTLQYSKTVFAGRQSTIGVPPFGTLIVDASPGSSGILVPRGLFGPGTPIPYNGTKLTIPNGGILPDIYTVICYSGRMRLTSGYIANPGQVTLTLTGPLTFAAGAAPGTLVANIGNVPAGVTPSLSPNDGRLVIAGDAVNGWKVVVGMVVASAGDISLIVSAAGAFDASATIGVTAVGSQFVSQTLRVGYLTRLGTGGVPVGAPGLGLLNSGTVSAWTLNRISGDAAAWPASVTTGLTPAPSRTLTIADGGSQAVYAVLADGVDTGSTITLNVQPSIETAGALTIGTKIEIDSASFGLRVAATRNALGGKRIELQRGCEAEFAFAEDGSSADLMEWRGFNGHTGIFTITSSDPTRKTVIGRTRLIGCKNITIEGLTFRRTLAPSTNPATSNKQNAGQLVINVSATFGDSANIIVRNNTFDSNGPNQTDASTWTTAIEVGGDTQGNNVITDITIQNNTITRCCNGITTNNVNRFLDDNNWIYWFCSNARFHGGTMSTAIIMQDGGSIHPAFNPRNTNDHRDHCQLGSALAQIGDWVGHKITRMMFLQGEGDSLAQGPFFDDTGKNSGAGATGPFIRPVGSVAASTVKATNRIFQNCEISNILFDGPANAGVSLDLGTGWYIRNVTLVWGNMKNVILRGPGQTDTGNQERQLDPKINAVSYEEVTGGAIRPVTGAAVGCVSQGTNGFQQMTKTNCVDLGSTGFPDLTIVPEPTRIAYYAERGFSNVGLADPKLAYAPTVGSQLDLGGGRFVGALNPDGSWADAR